MDKQRGNWTVLSTKDEYENPWIKVSHHDVLNPSGNPGLYGEVHYKNRAIGIVAINDKEEILMVRQFRFPLGYDTWEIPEGGCPLKEDNLEAAQRELKEETGCTAANWTSLIELELSNSVSDEVGEVFLATDLSEGDANPEETEDLEVKWFPLKEVKRMIFEKEIKDSVTITGVLAFLVKV